YELPGLWFNASEVHALLTMQHLLAGLDPGGLLGAHIQPLTARLNALLGSGDADANELRKRVRIFGVGARSPSLDHFENAGSALLRRRRLQITYYVRSHDEVTEREVSPQRLVHYRENWYLDAWCHWRRALRSFAVDAIRSSEILAKPAREVPERTLDAVLGAGYGIFSGRKITRARLRFTPERARWVAQEKWHPKQKSRFDAQGRYILELPYSDPRELVMDILKHGAEVEVLAPCALREEIENQLRRAIDNYQKPAAKKRH
ncbi:MAG: WYL domain-containing protein, partial [Pseudomonadota bacterium]|nr:WYL domain-containing protein [Pseudomonadota bacterium]